MAKEAVTMTRIAVLGAYGDVGLYAVRSLLSLGPCNLRLGGRDRERAREVTESLGVPGLEHQDVDACNERSLRRFIENSDIVLNCAGPSRVIGGRVAAAALQAGADYVDVAGDEILRGAIPGDWRARERTAILAAGLRPGFTGIAPRWLASKEFDRVDSLVSYFGVSARFTATAADDFLEAAANDESRALAAWRDGPRPSILRRRRDVDLPFFEPNATLLPALDSEGERIAGGLHLKRADFYSVISGKHMVEAVDRAISTERADGVKLLCHASALDIAGSQPHVTLLLELAGEHHGKAISRTLLFRGKGSAEISGAMAAISTRAIGDRQTTPGCYFADQALTPLPTMRSLHELAVVRTLEVLDATLCDLDRSEQGAL